MQNKLRTPQILSAIVLYLLASVAIALPLITITPENYTYHDPAIAHGTSLVVPYTITNNTHATLKKVIASNLPIGVTSSACPVLVPGGSCSLNLAIPATLTHNPGVIKSRFKVCLTKNLSCTLVSSANQLDITVVKNDTFLAISDMHVNIANTANITYGQDTGFNLWNSAKTELNSLINAQSPKFIVLLGDLPGHNDLLHLSANIASVLTGLSGLPAITEHNIPVFYAFGNNDSLVQNYGPYYDTTTMHNLFYLDPAHSSPATKGWPTLNANPDCSVSPTFACTYTTTSPMPPSHASDMANVTTGGGYYSAYPLGSSVPLRLISLNSVIFSRYYLRYAYDPVVQLADAQEQMNWLAAQLASASANNEFVYIIMHVPVGKDAFYSGAIRDMWNDTLYIENIPFPGDHLLFRDAYLALMTQYKSNIRTVLSGHTHSNELRALYSNQSLINMDVLDVGVPGVTVNHSNNSGMQAYLYDNTFQLTEAKTYYTTPIPSGWKTYSFQNDYTCPKNSTIFSCMLTNILPKLRVWKSEPQPIPGNPYEKDYSIRNSDYNPSPFSNWLTIFNTIQVVPIQKG